MQVVTHLIGIERTSGAHLTQLSSALLCAHRHHLYPCTLTTPHTTRTARADSLGVALKRCRCLSPLSLSLSLLLVAAAMSSFSAVRVVLPRLAGLSGAGGRRGLHSASTLRQATPNATTASAVSSTSSSSSSSGSVASSPSSDGASASPQPPAIDPSWDGEALMRHMEEEGAGHDEPHRLFHPPYDRRVTVGILMFCVFGGAGAILSAVIYQQRKGGFWFKKKQTQ